MQRSSLWPADRAEAGTAAIEFLVAGVVLLVPLVYLVLVLAAIQSSAAAATGAARQAARVYVTAPDEVTARTRAHAAADLAVADVQGPDASPRLTVSCSGAPRCLVPGRVVTVQVRVRVRLPLVPRVLGLGRDASVPVEGVAAERVSRFWSAR